MATFADLFTTNYLTDGSDVEFSKVRVHLRGADAVCRAFGATALTIGSDIYFRDGAFAPHTPTGLRILAHEVAHVVRSTRDRSPRGRSPRGRSLAAWTGASLTVSLAASRWLRPGRPRSTAWCSCAPGPLPWRVILAHRERIRHGCRVHVAGTA
jgi:hypothetical protein